MAERNPQVKSASGNESEETHEDEPAVSGEVSETGPEADESQDDIDRPYIRGYKWVSPVSTDSRAMAEFAREILESMSLEFERESSHRHYTKTSVIVPLPKFAYVFRFVVPSLDYLTLDFYDTKPTHGGHIYYMEADPVTEGNEENFKKILATLAEKTSRPPWKFTFTQRIQHGYFMPEFRRARKAWERMGIA